MIDNALQMTVRKAMYFEVDYVDDEMSAMARAKTTTCNSWDCEMAGLRRQLVVDRRCRSTKSVLVNCSHTNKLAR